MDELEKNLYESISNYLKSDEMVRNVTDMNNFFVNLLCSSVYKAYLAGYSKAKEEL